MVRHAYLAAVAVLACLNVGLLVSADGKNISPDASPSLDRGPTYECVKAQGYNPDGFIFVYRHGRTGANGRGTDLVRVAANEGRRKGMALSRLDIGLPGEREISVLKCFLGDNGLFERHFRMNPRLLCPKTGAVRDIYSGEPAFQQVRAFLESCR